jgi:UDP-glucuronate 4-epimerase
MTILVTGAAGFIGYHVAQALLDQGHEVIGLDNLNDYYDVSLKKARLKLLDDHVNFEFFKIDISDQKKMELFFKGPGARITHILHLAGQAGVRYSVTNPHVYVTSNVMGHLNVLEGARHLKDFKHMVYASSSSVYGANKKMPFSVDDEVNTPISLYAATKRADELMSYTYSHLYKIPQTGLRFFTVYGPWGRPDMSPILFCDAIAQGKPLQVFNNGNMKRDFTYVDDIVAGVLAAMDKPAAPDENGAPYALYNLGNHRSENLMDWIGEMEKAMGIEAIKEFKPLQPGDVIETYADIAATQKDLGYDPKTPISVGVPKFVAWYKQYYKIAVDQAA